MMNPQFNHSPAVQHQAPVYYQPQPSQMRYAMNQSMPPQHPPSHIQQQQHHPNMHPSGYDAYSMPPHQQHLQQQHHHPHHPSHHQPSQPNSQQMYMMHVSLFYKVNLVYMVVRGNYISNNIIICFLFLFYFYLI